MSREYDIHQYIGWVALVFRAYINATESCIDTTFLFSNVFLKYDNRFMSSV